MISFSQQNKIDSLLYNLKTAKSDTHKVEILLNLCWEFRSKNPQEAIGYGKQGLELSQKIKFKKGIANNLNNIGLVYGFLDQYSLAMEYYQQSLKIKKEIGNEAGIARTLHSIGSIYRQQGDYSSAIDYFLQALRIQEKLDDKKGVAIDLVSIGNVYFFQDNFEKALEFYQQALEIQKKLKNEIGIAECYHNIANIYGNWGQSSKAVEFYKLSLEMKERLEDREGIANSLMGLAMEYENLKDYPKALEYYSRSLKISEELEDMDNITLCLNNMGDAYLQLKQYQNALDYCLKSLGIAKEIGSKDNIKEAYFVLSRIYLALKDFKKAYEYHRSYSEIKDTLFNEENQNQITEMQTKYETEKKELQIENLNKDNAIKETEIKKQNVQKIAFASGFGLMLILAFVIFRGYRHKQKANEIISAQKTEVEKQKKMVDEKNKSLEVAYKHIEEKNTEILDSIRYAKRIQEAILPPQKLVKSYLENSFILYKPKDIVAGDFYWVSPPTPQRGDKPNAQAGSIVPGQLPPPIADGGAFLFACCDCTGHGVPGAFMSILGYNGLNRCVKEFGLTQPAAILDKLCELVDEAFAKSENDIKDGMDIALCSLQLPNPERVQNPFGVIQYAGAGNSLYHIRNGILTEFSPDKQPIGKFAYRKPFTNHEIQLQKDDAIYVFTDGYADQFGGPKGKKFKYSQFEKLLISFQDKIMTEQRDILNKTIDEWRGELEQIDDICIIGVRV